MGLLKSVSKTPSSREGGLEKNIPVRVQDVDQIINRVNLFLPNATDLNVPGNLSVTGTSTFNGAITLGDAAADSLTVKAVTTYDEPVNYSNETGITAFATGGQASATALTEEVNNVTTVVTAGDSVKLPTAVAGKHVYIKNSGATALAIFPALSDSIDALAVNLAVWIQPGSVINFYAKDAIVWESSIDTSLTLSAPTTLKGQLELKAADSAGNTLTSITNASQAAARTYTVPDAGANASFVMTQGAATIVQAAGNSFTIDADTTDHTGANVMLIDLGANSASVNALDISADVKTALSAAEIVKGINIDANALAADADTSAIQGLSITASTISTSRADIKGIFVTTDGTMDTADTVYGIQIDQNANQSAAIEGAGLFIDSDAVINDAGATHYGILIDTRDVTDTASTEISGTKIYLGSQTGTGKGLSIDAAVVDHSAGNLIDVDADAADIVAGSLKALNVTIDETVAGTNGTSIIGSEIDITGFATGRADLIGQSVKLNGTKNGGDSTTGIKVDTEVLTLNNAGESFIGLNVDADTIVNTASSSVTGIVVSMPPVVTGATPVGVSITMNATTELAISTNAEIQCAEISSTGTLITSMVTPTVGTGFDGAAVAKWIPYGKVGTTFVNEFIFDLTNLVNSTTTDDIIGETATANCNFGRITAAVHGTIFTMEITCLETPAGGDPDIDFYSATEATGTENALVTDLTETLLLARGASWAINDKLSVVTALPAADQYLYLAVGSAGGAPGTYTAGKFKIKFYGV